MTYVLIVISYLLGGTETFPVIQKAHLYVDNANCQKELDRLFELYSDNENNYPEYIITSEGVRGFKYKATSGRREDMNFIYCIKADTPSDQIPLFVERNKN